MQGRAITRSWSVPLVGALALAPVPAADAAPGAAPRGRVIRVERESAAAVPRLCLMGLGGDSHLCFGQPRPGERITMFSATQTRPRGELVIESVSEAADMRSAGLCISGGAQNVKGWSTTDADERDLVAGLRNARLDAEVARVLSGVAAPSGRADERVDLAVDTDGNSSADLVVTAYSCTPEGEPSSGTGSHARCFDTYMVRRGKLRRVQQDIIRACR